MPININQITSNTTQTKNAGEQKNVVNLDKITKNSTQSSEKATLSPDSVNLTASATRIKALEEQVARLPIVDTNKIEQIKSSIDEGSYEVNPERIATKMIQLENDLQR